MCGRRTYTYSPEFNLNGIKKEQKRNHLNYRKIRMILFKSKKLGKVKEQLKETEANHCAYSTIKI